MKLLIVHNTECGPVFIGRRPDGGYCVVWKGESLGGYGSVQGAINDAAGGHTFSPSDGVDLGALGISDDVADWSPVAAGAK